MKYLKTFENYDLGRFSEEEEILRPEADSYEEEEQECEPCGTDEEEGDEYTFHSETEEEEEEVEPQEVHRIRRWGDEVVESKKAKPDFLDLDKDGNKKESMKKAAKDAKENKKDSKKDDKKEDKKEEKGGKGLSAAQKKLPPALQKAIEAKNKKK